MQINALSIISFQDAEQANGANSMLFLFIFLVKYSPVISQYEACRYVEEGVDQNEALSKPFPSGHHMPLY